MQEPEVLTVLFTDVVGSTELLARLGDDAADSVRRAHFELLRSAIAEHRGREVKSLGDGLMVAFGSARDAVACAVAMQRAVAAERGALELRIGIDAGEPIHEGDDLFGTPVVVARRLCDAAASGQVLVSDLVRLLGGRRLNEPLVPLGSLGLKGLDEPVVAHEVLWRTPAQTPVADDSRAPPPLPLALGRAAEHPFVSRRHELDALHRAWELARGGDGRTVVLAGEPGIGKTSLTAVFAREAYSSGARVLLGRCHPEALVPYEPFVEALRQLPPAALAKRSRTLARVMPELLAGAPPTAPADDQAERYVLFEAVAHTLAEAARDAPLVLVLEDLHWADQPTLLLLRHSARASERAPLLTLLTFRTTEVPGTEHVMSALTDLERELAFDRITLGGLRDGEVAEMVEEVHGGRASSPLGTALHRETAGNPLFIGQLLRHLEETGALVERDGELALTTPGTGLGVPESIKELVGRRLSSLTEETVSTLRTGAVIGRSFPHEVLVWVERNELDALVDSLEEATAAGLLEESVAGRHAFVHALVREAIYEQTSATRRAGLHRRVAEALEASGGAEPAELAHHFLAARDTGKGLEYSLAAAERSLGQLAYEDAAAHFRRALGALGDEDAGRRCELLIGLADAQARGGDMPAAKVAYRDAAELADNPEHLARAALGYGGRIIWEVSRDDPFMIPLLERAIENLGDADSPLRVRLLVRLAGGPLRDARFPRSRRSDLSREALEMARRLGDPVTLAYAIDGYILAHHGPDQTHEQLRLARELVDVALEGGDKERAMEGFEEQFDARFELGDVAGAERALASMAELARELRQPSQQWFVAVYRALLALHKGDLREAEHMITAARRLGETAQAWNAVVSYGLQLYVLRWQQGRIEEVEKLVRRSAEQNPSYHVWDCALAHLAAKLRYHAEASELFGALAEREFAGVPFDEEWLVSMCLLAETANAAGTAQQADVLHGQLLPYADRVAISYPEISLGAVARYLGIAAAAARRWDEAEYHFRSAHELNGRVKGRPWAAHTQRDHAEMLLARGSGSDRRRARELISSAVAAYSSLGMQHWAERARDLERVGSSAGSA
ncbi:MAG TPA: AAA family ATPase [Thermoleophilaceae bacterium]